MKKELVWNIIGFEKYNKNTHFLRKSLLIKNGLGRNYQPFTEPKFPWLKGSVMLKECSDTLQMWTSPQKEFVPVTRTPYATTLKGPTAAGARMDIKAMGLYVKVNI